MTSSHWYTSWRGAAASHIGHSIRARPLAAATILAACLFVATLSILDPYYETNDDAVMNSIAAGQLLTGEPDEHLVFTNVLIGLVLKRLYQTFPEGPWYGGYLLAVHLLSTIGLLFGLLRFNASGRQLVFLLVVFVLLVVPGLSHVQFTRTASLATLAGLSLFLSAVSLTRPQSRVYQLLCAAALIFIGSLIRWQACVLVVMLATPIAAYVTVLREGVSRAALIRAAAFIGATGAVCLAAWSFNQASYAQDAGWERFWRLQRFRTGVTDYRRLDFTPETKTHFDSADWSENDLRMVRDWFGFLDDEVYSDEKLAYLEANAFSEDRVFDYQRLPQLGRLLLADRMLAALGLLVIARLAQTSVDTRNLVMVGAVFGLSLLAAWFVVTDLRLVSRVSHAMFSVPVLAVMTLPYLPGGWWRSASSIERVMRVAPVAVLVPVVLIYGAGRLDASEVRLAASRDTVERIKMLDLEPDDVVVVWGGDLPYEEMVRPLDDGQLEDVTLLATGWPVLSPFTTERIRHLGIDNLYQALYTRDDLYLAAFGMRLPGYARFVCEHYGQELAFDVWNDEPRIYTIDAADMRSRQVGPRRTEIVIRWKGDVETGVRQTQEQQFGLGAPTHIDGSTWQYDVTDRSDLTGLVLADTVELMSRQINQATQANDELPPGFTTCDDRE